MYIKSLSPVIKGKNHVSQNVMPTPNLDVFKLSQQDINTFRIANQPDLDLPKFDCYIINNETVINQPKVELTTKSSKECLSNHSERIKDV